ncbi:DUF3082 domain-containing protein [Prochlorococcus marinus]|uniref:DUF3082 domain-containing protein n=1 Tax=Prochlorococcus marinus TaxID=1219 RepID=UPI0022B5605F|nr:DUF3082 domain-containing protein [Prochlorococcus marinus]
MNSPSNGFNNESDESANPSLSPLDTASSEPKKGPLSFLSGSITSLSFSLLSLFISKKIVLYFSIHTPNYSSPIAQSIASGFKTLIIGISFLATFTFGFIGLGLFLVFIRSLIEGNKQKTD